MGIQKLCFAQNKNIKTVPTFLFVIPSLALASDWIHKLRASCDNPWNVVF